MKSKYKVKKINGKNYEVHRLVFEKHLGRPLDTNEVVHHIDGDKGNNKLSNLMLFPNKRAHIKYHALQGDLKLFNGQNKKTLIKGKLKCYICEEFKELNKFVTRKQAHLGFLGICRKCRKLQRRHGT